MYVTNFKDKIQIHLEEDDRMVGSYMCDEIVIHHVNDRKTALQLLEVVNYNKPITLWCDSNTEITPTMELYLDKIYWDDEDITLAKKYRWECVAKWEEQ